MTRVVLWPSAYLPALGGVEELTRHLALALVALGDEVEVWASTDRESDRPTVSSMDGLTVRRFPLPLPARRPSTLIRFPPGALRGLRAMRAAVHEFRPDLLHVQCFGPNGIYANLLSRITGLPLVVTLQGETVMDDQNIFETSTTMRAGLRSGLRHAAAVSACSQFTLADAEQRFGLAAGRGQVIFNGVDLAAASPVPTDDPERGSTDGHRFVFAVGRVVEKKGFDLLLRAFAPLADIHDDVDVMIGGDGSALASLRELATQLGIVDRVTFPGRLSRTEVASMMAGAEVVVMPSRLEPFGIVVLEAWRAGRPIVATSNGGPKEFIKDGKDGMLVDPFDVAAMTKTLDGLLSDAALCRMLGDAGRYRAAAFDWPIVTSHYRSLYSVVLAPKGR